MSQLNDVLDQSVRAQDAPFLVAMVGDKDGASGRTRRATVRPDKRRRKIRYSGSSR